MSDLLSLMPEFTDRSLLSTHRLILRLDVQSSDIFASAQRLIPPIYIDLPLLIEASLASLKCTLDKHYQLVLSKIRDSTRSWGLEAL